jgi:aminomethyltransferase
MDMNMERWPVLANGATVGRITSAVYSPRMGKNIGYAMVPIELAALDTTLTVDTHVGPREATVVERPFVDPTKEIPKS